jgi:outer membrane protein
MKKIYILLLIYVSFSTVIMGEPGETSDTKYILRPIYGRANYSKLRRTFGEFDQWDEQESYFAGLQVERFLSKDFKGLPLDFTFLTSLLYHSQDIIKSDGQYTQPMELNGEDTYQINFAVKLYYKKFPWSNRIRTRLGVGEGMSYVGEYLDIETQNFNSESKEARSKLLNYMDISLSFNIGDIFGKEEFNNSYAGIGISHRSGIQGVINDVRGGSNFATLFLEFEI